MASEETLTYYPPLNCCILIDSRLSSRREILSYINSTRLFETIIEPDSLAMSVEILLKNQVDTCIFGPSLKTQNLKGFFSDLQKSSYKEDCAFIAIHKDDDSNSVEGVHANAKFPCSKKEFNFAIVEALKNANGGVLPTSKRNNPIDGSPISLTDVIGDFFKEPDRASSQTNGSDAPLSKLSSLSKLLADIEPSNLMFKVNGDPSGKTTEVVGEMLESLLPSKIIDSEVVCFKQCLEQFIYRWIVNANQSGRKVANSKLREEIQQYFAA